MTTMKSVNAIHIRYMGPDWHRVFVVQRANGEFWSGNSWTKILDCAKVYRKHRDAQRDCSVIQYRRWRGKPIRTFRVEVHLTLVADEVHGITNEEVRQFLSDSVRIDIESVHGEGPGDNSYLHARMSLVTLKETEPSRKRF